MLVALGMLIFVTVDVRPQNPALLQQTASQLSEGKAREFYFNELGAASLRIGKLSDIALGSFQIVIGALIAFLGGLASKALETKSATRSNDSKESPGTVE